MNVIYDMVESIGTKYMTGTGLRNAAVALYEMPIWTELTPDQHMMVTTVVNVMGVYSDDLSDIDRQIEEVTRIVIPARCGIDVQNAVSALRGALVYEAEKRMKDALYAMDTDKAALDGLLGDAFVPFDLRPALIRRVLKLEAAAHAEDA